MNDDCKFRGRKLVLEWGKLKIEISKLPYLDGKDKLMFGLFGSNVLLANVYEGPDGKLVDEVLGAPAGPKGNGTCLDGMTVKEYLTNDAYWMTAGEAEGGLT